MSNLPKTQYAVQLVGPNQPVLNKAKTIVPPGRHQIVCRVEAVGLCFSDLKLLKQFSTHPRKTEIAGGIDNEVLKEISSYVPGDKPTVPGHEAVVRVEAVGPGVKRFKRGERYLVQTDYRWLPTAQSNASFGYNFEGALQEYVLMDERVITSPEGESMLIPAPEDLSASAIALIEPWACVEDAYASAERQRIKPGGKMLIVADKEVSDGTLREMFGTFGRPAKATWVSANAPPFADVAVESRNTASDLPDGAYDDVIYFGCDAGKIEELFAKVGPKGLFNIVLCNGRLGRDVITQVGRIHYGGIRIVGTTSSDPADSMRYIPHTGEIRKGDVINVIGAGGPMGLMHVIRNICQSVPGVKVFAGDVDDGRLAVLAKIANPLAKKNGVEFRTYNASKEKIEDRFSYVALMAPVPELVAAAVKSAGRGGIINIFAGIPATVTGKIDIDGYIEKQLYFIGTSGSVLEDMKQVLAKVVSGRLDTNVSVAAVSGLDGACDGIRAVENRSIAGKIIVYPSCKGLALTPLEKLAGTMPAVAARLNDGLWTPQAEQELLHKQC
jgi:threonine dehydrogenase-like Zn-dependent dehydrogenase